jgi:hypothetical protein
MRFLSFGVVGATVLLFVGCGGNSSGVASRIDVRFPSQTFTFDTSTGVTVPAGGTFPSVACGTGTDCYSGLVDSPNNVVAPATPLKCVQEQPFGSATCVAQIPETMSSMVVLAGQPGISGGGSLVDITITGLSYAVANNTVNVDLLGVTLYLAPSGVTDPNDPQAVPFGTLPTLPSGAEPQGDVQLMPTSVETMEMFTGNTSIPFDLIAATTVNVPGGSTVGHVAVTVSGTLSAYDLGPK